MNAEHRLAAYRRRLVDERVDGALITHPANMRYLTGFDSVFDEGINAACLITPEVSRFYTDARYVEAAVAAADGTPWAVRLIKESLYVELCAELHGERVETLSLESSVPWGRFRYLSEQFAGKIVMREQWVEQQRRLKEPAEIEAIAAAAQLADAAFEHICGYIRSGMREVDIAIELEMYMRRQGSDGVAFEPIVAAGPNGARPHSRPGEHVLAAGELVVLDLGARVDGYCSDLTRTVVVVAAGDRERETHAAVLQANEAGRAVVRSGVRACDVDRAAREVLESRGLADKFTHGVGHGVGLAVHESPAVNMSNGEPLRAGTVLTVEPGVYVSGWGGVRIEDLVLVEAAGCRCLSSAPRVLIEVG